ACPARGRRQLAGFGRPLLGTEPSFTTRLVAAEGCDRGATEGAQQSDHDFAAGVSQGDAGGVDEVRPTGQPTE
ncbi:MAG: hypothetical protein ACRD12_06250, partial [Acidimicrobiales bacterium]